MTVGIIGARVFAGDDLCSGPGKERGQLRVGFGAKVTRRLRANIIFIRQALDLIRIEHTIGARIGYVFLNALFVLAGEGAVFDNGRGCLAASDPGRQAPWPACR